VKILVVTNFYPPEFLGGYELACSQVVEGLRGNGHHVLVCTASSHLGVINEPHVLRYFQLSDVYRPVAMRTDCQLLDDVKAKIINFHNVSVLLDVTASFCPDVIYLWNLLGLGVAGIVSVVNFLKLPWVWHLMDRVPVEVLALRDARPRFLFEESSSLKFGRGTVIAVSNSLVEECRSFGIDLGDRIFLLPTWISRNNELTGRSQGGEILRCLYVGTLGQHKGTGLIVEAARILVQEGRTNFVIDLYGLGDTSGYRAKVLQDRLQPYVRFHGPKQPLEVDELYLDHDVFLFPTHSREPNAFTVYEAAGAGCVPIISRICGNAEWLVENVHVIKIDRSAGALAEVLGATLDGNVGLEDLRRRGSRAVRTDFTLGSILPRIEQILETSARQPSYDAHRWQAAKIVYNLLEKVAIQTIFS
jgi:glycogen synthase